MAVTSPGSDREGGLSPRRGASSNPDPRRRTYRPSVPPSAKKRVGKFRAAALGVVGLGVVGVAGGNIAKAYGWEGIDHPAAAYVGLGKEAASASPETQENRNTNWLNSAQVLRHYYDGFESGDDIAALNSEVVTLRTEKAKVEEGEEFEDQDRLTELEKKFGDDINRPATLMAGLTDATRTAMIRRFADWRNATPASGTPGIPTTAERDTLYEAVEKGNDLSRTQEERIMAIITKVYNAEHERFAKELTTSRGTYWTETFPRANSIAELMSLLTQMKDEADSAATPQVVETKLETDGMIAACTRLGALISSSSDRAELGRVATYMGSVIADTEVHQTSRDQASAIIRAITTRLGQVDVEYSAGRKKHFEDRINSATPFTIAGIVSDLSRETPVAGSRWAREIGAVRTALREKRREVVRQHHRVIEGIAYSDLARARASQREENDGDSNRPISQWRALMSDGQPGTLESDLSYNIVVGTDAEPALRALRDQELFNKIKRYALGVRAFIQPPKGTERDRAELNLLRQDIRDALKSKTLLAALGQTHVRALQDLIRSLHIDLNPNSPDRAR